MAPWRGAIVALTLTLATVIAYWGVWHNDFITIDDPYYVTDEPMVLAGLTPRGVVWAFTTNSASNYHPLTWLSHMLDVELFGVRASVHHAINLAIHIVNTLLLLLVFWRMTGAMWASAFIAGVFALHPLHVESVAWVAERKDVLSTFFALLTTLAYKWYVRNGSAARYVLVFVLLALGLMAKPMLVTWPFVLMLLDVWPLGRSTLWRRADDDSEALTPVELFLEKLPLLLLSAISSGLTIWAQRAGGAVTALEEVSLLGRVLNPLTAYGRYVFKTFWPDRLAVYYPYTRVYSLIELVLCAAVLVGASVLAIRWLRTRPWFAVGWFWFVGTLVPVIGIVQVGVQAMADRYMYIPMIGLTIIIAFGAVELAQKRAQLRPIFAVVALVILIALAVRTQLQTRHWKNSLTLGTHTLRTTTHENWLAHFLAGSGYAMQNDAENAIKHFEVANRMRRGRYDAILRDLHAKRERQANP